MTQEMFWTYIGPHFFIVVGLFILYAARGYTEEYHEEMDWENQNWAGATSKNVLENVPYWVVKGLFALMGFGFLGLYLYAFFDVILPALT
ncbi:hypothetical protein [Guptibacillus algicola]|uniref:hypothetical protein n=1 Tax=Guptibacillus algicola TaxID=225844 RepID=UPI001CD20514|nr:hypothetical protein [Alkalihalobacillus algicola]MCA0985709.1 hypothetical protein [Alkalihalobacillus algicola]